MMFVRAYDNYSTRDGAPSTDGLTEIFVALSTVQTMREIGAGWTELSTHNHLRFYIPRPPQRVAEDGLGFGMVTP